MSKKVFLITVFIVSLLLLGLMLLIADVRMNTILDDFSTMEEEFKNTNTSLEQEKERQFEATADTYPEIIQQYERVAKDLLEHIQNLKNDYIVKSDNYEEMDAHKNEILFIKGSNVYTEKGNNLMTKIEAYENMLVIVNLEFPETKTTSSKLRNTDKTKDWLVYNFKDFPAIAVYTQLTAMEATIETKRKDIITFALTAK